MKRDHPYRGFEKPRIWRVLNRGIDDLKAFKRIGALLLMASKPDVRNPAPGYTIY